MNLRRTRRRRRERGASLVEAAIVMLPFFTLVFGLFEGALLLADSLGTAHAAKAGVRTGSALATDELTDYQILKAIAREGSALRRGDIERIVIYESDATGAAPTAACRAGTPSTGVCNVYVSADLARPATDFGCKSTTALDGFWCPNTRRISLSVENGGPPDYLGVWIQTEHRMITGLVGKDRTLMERAVLRLEPRRT